MEVGADRMASTVLMIKRLSVGDGINTVLCVYIGI